VEFVRVGDKVLNRAKIDRAIDRILQLRLQGMSQQEVANEMGIDRTFVSRLEGLGEVRTGGSVAVLGFPIGNKDEIERISREEGVEYSLLMTDTERWDFVKGKDGSAMLNELLRLIFEFRKYETVVLMGSDWRINLMRGLLDKEVVPVVLGQSPITGDVIVDPDEFRTLLKSLRGEL
jgi:transcriptional regulator with XRE-family HTH domain